MIFISEQEIIKLAEISRLEINADEIGALQEQIQAVLSYAQRVQEISADLTEQPHPIHNVLREDVPVNGPSTAVLESSVKHELGYYVVPAVLAKSGE